MLNPWALSCQNSHRGTRERSGGSTNDLALATGTSREIRFAKVRIARRDHRK
jgi:hypothetical protein